MTMMAGRDGGETGEPGGMLGGVGFGMSRAFSLPLRSLVRRDLVRRDLVRRDHVRVLPLALLLRLGYEVTGAGGSRTFLGLVV